MTISGHPAVPQVAALAEAGAKRRPKSLASACRDLISRSIRVSCPTCKTTLLMLLAGLRVPASGEIVVEDQMIDRPRPRTGLVLQEYGLLPWATIWPLAGSSRPNSPAR